MINVIVPIGTFFAGVYFSRKQGMESIRIIEFNRGAADFRASFVEIIFKLRKNKTSFDFQIMTEEVFIGHEKAKIIFEPFVDHRELKRFNEAWKKYLNTNDEYNRDEKNPNFASPEGIEKISMLYLHHIADLLEFAKPKF
jgi:hypothetical protein